MLTFNRKQACQATQRILERCEQLGSLSAEVNATTRLHLTPEHRQANQQAQQWMQEAGMITWQDAAANIWGRYESTQPNAKTLIIGSHLDTVPNAGKYDGILGVLSAIELVHWCNAQQLQFPFHIDVVGFADEEGARFGVTLIGSNAVAGKFTSEWLSAVDRDGLSLQAAYEQFGLNPNKVGSAAINPEQVLAYFETHIEQGPVLESLNQSLGIVTGIAGAKRAMIEFSGMAGHAGTTPMNLRQDALVAAAKAVVAIESLAKQARYGEVATVGQMKVQPGATNVIAAHAQISLDVRALDDDHRETLINLIQAEIAQISVEHQVEVSWQWTHQAGAVLCDEQWQAKLVSAAKSLDIDIPSLPSGAGHDAMAMAAIAPVAMLFVRSPGGISHNPKESVIASDVADALQLMAATLLNLQ